MAVTSSSTPNGLTAAEHCEEWCGDDACLTLSEMIHCRRFHGQVLAHPIVDGDLQTQRAIHDR